LIERIPGVTVTGVSRWHATRAIGGPADQPDFLNGAICLETTLGPWALSMALRGVEDSLGRTRRVRWDSRTIDIDLLLYDDLVMDTDKLTIPHPRMAFRRFVLEPACEVAGDWVHPVIHWTLSRLLQHLLTCPPRFALCGFATLGWLDISAAVQSRLKCEAVFDAAGYGDNGSLADRDWQLQCLERRARLLESSSWNTAVVPIIADFVLEESLLLAELTLDAEKSEPIRDAAGRRVVGFSKPKLLVVIQPASANRPLSLSDRFSDSLCRYAAESRLAPVLRIFEENRDFAVEEITAAIDSMK
jgi:2-amino-4-hydroxy-6-hydroxymethyldihydropteridine diphosphokinase